MGVSQSKGPFEIICLKRCLQRPRGGNIRPKIPQWKEGGTPMKSIHASIVPFISGVVVVAMAAPWARAQCGTGGTCTGSTSPTVYQISCGPYAPAMINIPNAPPPNWVVPYWWQNICVPGCCGGQMSSYELEGAWDCAVLTLRKQQDPGGKPPRDAAEMVYLVRECDGGYSTVVFNLPS